MDNTTSSTNSRFAFLTTGYTWIIFLVLAIGVGLRLYPTSDPHIIGFDESYYGRYVKMLDAVGVYNYPAIVGEYIRKLHQIEFGFLPPTRFLFIFAGYVWRSATGAHPLDALHQVACLFSILTLPLAYIFTRRLTDKWTALGVLALMVCSPLQIYTSQHALSDGFFVFWALLSLWLLWENLQRPNSGKLLAAFAASLALIVMTKENSFFVYIGMCSLVCVNPWLKFGTVTKRLLVTMFVGPFLGVLALVVLAGGIRPLLELYPLFVSKSVINPYAIITGDGPWFRYIMDLLLVSPVVLLLAIGSIFQLSLEKKQHLFLSVFVAATYVLMCNVHNGMNLRYGIIWDLPLRILAFSQIAAICARFGARRYGILTFAIALFCAIDLRQYGIICVQYRIYELVSSALLSAQHLLK